MTAASLPAKPEKLKPAQAVDAYLAVVEDDGQTAVKRNYAAAQIVKLGDKAVPRIMALYRCAPAGRRGRLADVLSGMTTPDPEAVKMLLEDLKANGVRTHVAVIRALGDLKVPEASPLLLELLPSASGTTRVATLHALGRLDDEQAAGALHAGLDAPDRLVRITCANAVVRLLVKLKAKPGAEKTKSAYRELTAKAVRYIEHGKHPDVRRIFAAGMGVVGDSRSAPPLRRVLRLESGGLQLAAARALGQLKDRDAVDPLTDTLYGDQTMLKRVALEALAAIGDENCVPVLIDQLEVSRAKERKDIVRALRQLTGQSYGGNPHQWRRWWKTH